MNYFECCHKCVPPKRYPGCSGTCPEYAEARAKFDADKAKNKQHVLMDQYAGAKNSATKDGIAKYTKRRSRKLYF